MTDLVKETLSLAKQTNLAVSEICKAAGVKQRWYYRFLAGDFQDPGVNKILRLHSVLSGKHQSRRATDRAGA